VQNGKVRRGYLGVILDSVKAEYAKVYGLKDTGGAIVTDVATLERSGESRFAGRRCRRRIQRAENSERAGFNRKVAATKPDESVSMVFWREAA
jgi:S1-C subfamily serine protease